MKSFSYYRTVLTILLALGILDRDEGEGVKWKCLLGIDKIIK